VTRGAVLSRPGTVLAVIRLATIPLLVLAERLVEHPEPRSTPFEVLAALALVYALAMFVAEVRGATARIPAWTAAVADLVLISVLVYTSGGPFSQLRFAFFILPVGAALLLRPALTAAASGACVLAYLAIVAAYPGGVPGQPDPLPFEVTQALFLLWMGAAATLLSAVLTRRNRDVEDLARSRGRLVAQALAAEDTTRRRLAEALHDDALQNLLAARQELGAGDDASIDLVREGLDQAVVQLREAVFDLHPHLLDQAGLRAALQAVAERAGRRGRFTPAVEVDPGAEGVRDDLVFSVARELLANAARHSGAEHVRVRVRRRDARSPEVELLVADDGVGIPPGALEAAPRRGHIGLASAAERAEAVGGAFTVGPGTGGRGTVVRVTVPAAPPAGAPGAAGREGSIGGPPVAAGTSRPE
jgi:two-component system NarL family sensor kinase